MHDSGETPLEAATFGTFNRAVVEIYARKRMCDLGVWSMAQLTDWMRAEWRHIDLSRDAFDASKLSFLSPAFLECARQGAPAIAARTLGGDIEPMSGVSSRTRAAILAGRVGHNRVLCPFTGALKRVVHSIGPLWSLVEEGEEFCLAGAIGSPMIDVHLETTWVFPVHKLVLQVRMAFAEHFAPASAVELFERSFRMQEDLVTYLNRTPPKDGDGVSLCEFTSPHICHNLWNLHAAWFNIFDKAAPTSYRALITLAGQNYYGTLDELYSERMQGAHVVELENEDEAFRYALRNGGVTMTVKDEFLQPAFIENVVACARKRCSAAFFAELERVRAASDPLIVVSLRLDNRAWIEQREGLPMFLAALREDFPRLGVVLDGLSSDTDKGWSTAWMSLEADRELAEAVYAAAPAEMPFFVAVGRSFSEAIAACAAADAFVAPIGAAQTVSKWLGGLPGLAFSNTTVLRGVRGEGPWTALNINFSPRYMPEISPTRFMPTQDIIDGPVRHDDPQRTNFHMDWRALHREAKAMLETIGRRQF